MCYEEKESSIEITLEKEGNGFAGEIPVRNLTFELRNSAPVNTVSCSTHKTELVFENNTAKITVHNVKAEEDLKITIE